MITCSSGMRLYICWMKPAGKAYLPLLMGITLLVVTGFQLFWLSQIFKREKETLDTRTGIEFRDAMLKLQAKELRYKLQSQKGQDSSFNYIIKTGSDSSDLDDKTAAMVGMVDIMNGNDSMSQGENGIAVETMEMQINQSPRIIISNKRAGRTIDIKGPDSMLKNGNILVTMIKKIDSITESIDSADLHKAVEENFRSAGIDVPFSIYRTTDSVNRNLPASAKVYRAGFAKSAHYEMIIGNSLFYYIRKMALPLLFSLFLVGVTLASFLLLYRSLKQQQKLALLKNDFISNITHELKTPIATVTVALEALQNFNAINDPVKTASYLEMSQQELKRLSLLVDKVLRVSMFENSKVELKREQVDLVTLMHEVMASMRLQFDKTGATVGLHLQGVDFTITADRLHLLSVVYNLFDNAIKYCKVEPRLDVYLTAQADAIDLRFVDNGIGIPAGYQDKVFDKFFRVPTGDIHDVKGYGLGLSYVAHIVREHGGKISLQSVEGKGSTFIIQLPRKYD
jgi:two-component system, OmpR family, phosphate regulon sensor histidine kinase PhoR